MKSNAEIAREIVETWIAPDDIPPIFPEDAEELIVRVESALTTAQSELARQVLEEVSKYKGTFALVGGVEGGIVDVTCNQIEQRLRDLFTRS